MTFIRVRVNNNAAINHEILGTDFINEATHKQVPACIIQIMMIFIRQLFNVLKRCVICG